MWWGGSEKYECGWWCSGLGSVKAAREKKDQALVGHEEGTAVGPEPPVCQWKHDSECENRCVSRTTPAFSCGPGGPAPPIPRRPKWLSPPTAKPEASCLLCPLIRGAVTAGWVLRVLALPWVWPAPLCVFPPSGWWTCICVHTGMEGEWWAGRKGQWRETERERELKFWETERGREERY